MASSYLLGGCRTPIGRFQGQLSSLAATEMGRVVVRETLRRSQTDPAAIQEVILGQVLTAGAGQAPARQSALAAGVLPTVAALTINKVCGSGLKAVMLADQAIRAGDADRIVAGGMESMSRAPFLYARGSKERKFGHQSIELTDSMINDGLHCSLSESGMAELAERMAAKHEISRAAQDAFALESHRRAIASAGVLQREIVAVPITQADNQTQVESDEGPRASTSLEALAKLPCVCGPDPQNTITAGNASQISDGAAALVVASEQIANAADSPTKARIVATATSGVAPEDLFIAPVSAIRSVLKKAKMTLGDIDLIELNEAFAVQCLACMQELGIDYEKMNIHGGAIALGHPIGCSGARCLVTLLHALANRNLTTGLVSLCLGGGNAVAMIVERH